MALWRKGKKKKGVAERAIRARLAGKGYAAVMREAEGLNISTAKPKKRKRSEWLGYIRTAISSDLLKRMLRTEPAAWGIEAARGRRLRRKRRR